MAVCSQLWIEESHQEPIATATLPFFGNDLVGFLGDEAKKSNKATEDESLKASEHEFLAEFVAQAVQEGKLTEEDILKKADPDLVAKGASGPALPKDPDLAKKDIQNWMPIVKLVQFIDDKFPDLSGYTISRILRTVHIYLADEEVRDAIDNKVINAIVNTAPTIIVGHSLGSVVAFNVLNKIKAATIPLFVTVGSPLGIRAVRHRLPKKLSVPAKVNAWHNFYDRQDIVALNPLKGDFFSTSFSIANSDHIKNATDNHHGIKHYLDDDKVAELIGDARKSEFSK